MYTHRAIIGIITASVIIVIIYYSVRTSLRKVGKVVATIVALIAALTYVVAAHAEDMPALRYIWQASADAGLAALIIELFLRKSDAKDARSQLSELERLSAMDAPRRLSEDQRKILVEGLAKYTGQRFLIYIGVENSEGVALATAIATTLQDGCGWNPICDKGIETCSEISMTPGVIVYTTKSEKFEIRDIFEKAGLIRTTKVQMMSSPLKNNLLLLSHGSAVFPGADFLPDTVFILIGKKPLPVAS